MRRTIVLIASTVIVASISAVAAECKSNKGIDVTQIASATVRSQPVDAADNEKTCRAYAASFYESVTRRQAAYASGKLTLALLDSVINAFNELLAMKCGGLNFLFAEESKSTEAADDPLLSHEHLDVASDLHNSTSVFESSHQRDL